MGPPRPVRRPIRCNSCWPSADRSGRTPAPAQLLPRRDDAAPFCDLDQLVLRTEWERPPLQAVDGRKMPDEILGRWRRGALGQPAFGDADEHTCVPTSDDRIDAVRDVTLLAAEVDEEGRDEFRERGKGARDRTSPGADRWLALVLLRVPRCWSFHWEG